MDFPRGRGGPKGKTWNFRGVGEVQQDPLEWKIVGGGGQTGKPSVGGVWIFSGTTQRNLIISVVGIELRGLYA